MNVIEFNVNHHVLVKLTEAGIDELREQHRELSLSFPSIRSKFTLPEVNEDGYSRFQMHELMNTFGHMMSCGCDLPFETTILIESES